MEQRRFSSAVPPTHNGAAEAQQQAVRKVSYAGTGGKKYEYNVVPRSIVNMREEDLGDEEEEDPYKRRRRLGIPFEEDFAKKRSKS